MPIPLDRRALVDSYERGEHPTAYLDRLSAYADAVPYVDKVVRLLMNAGASLSGALHYAAEALSGGDLDHAGRALSTVPEVRERYADAVRTEVDFVRFMFGHDLIL